MHVFHIMTAESHGGAETYAADAILALAERGVKQSAFISKNALCNAPFRAAGITVYDDWSGCRFKPWVRHKLKQAIKAEQPTLIHCWMRRAAELVPAGLTVPVIGWLGGYYNIAKFKRCTAFVGVTHDIARHIKDNGVPADQTFTVHTFSSIEEQAIPASRRALDTPDGAPLLLTLSRLHSKKGLDTLLKALKDLPTAYLWLAGDGPLEQPLKNLAASFGVADRVRFLGWRTDRGALLKAADICVLPSRYEPFGTVMVEAWAAGTPLVAAAAAGPKAYIKPGETGLLVAPDDALALSTALTTLITTPSLRESLIAAGKQEYQAHFTKQASTEAMLAVYAGLTTQAPPLSLRNLSQSAL